MGLLKQVVKATGRYERGANYELGQSLSTSSVSSLFGTGGSDINVLEEYAGIAWKCIDVRAERLADQDLYVQQLIGGKWQQQPNHPFNLVLEGGDGQNDLSELLEAHEKSMCLYGESFWYFSKGESTGKPYAVYLLDPSSMTLYVAGQKVTGYVYQKDGDRITFEPEEIAHFKTQDWRHPFRGTGPMQSAGWFIRSSRYTMTFVNNFLENNAIPAGVVVAKGDVSDPDWNLFKSEWANKYSGIDNAGKTGFIRGQDLDFVKTGLSLGEVDFDKVKKSDREDIMVMFGISKPMMAIFDDINRASAVTAERLFAKSITSPSLKRLQRKLSKKVVKWYGQQYQVGTTNPVPDDEETKLNIYDKGVNRWITVNEARAQYGLEPIDGGDELKPEDKATTEAAKSVGTVKIVTKNTKVSYSYEMKESFRSNTQELQEKYEAQVYKATNPILAKQREDVLDQLQPKKLIDANLDTAKETEKLASEIIPIYIELAKNQGLLAAQFVGNESSEFVVTPAIERYIRESLTSSVLSFTQETKEKIADALQEGLTQGESIARIGKRINGIYDELLGVKQVGFRTERLVRTEVIKTSNEITETAYKQSGVVRKKEWFANPNHCEFCASLNGSIIQLGGVYAPKGTELTGADGGTRVNDYEDVKHPPIHPQCRCTLIPVIED